ncbi:MAG: PhnD/SsuA/transferrin family substrate-binding protein [Myxococcales bacterium]|nr:PhnD/SsuA/transferrin family substrate-binding protein [Myxococcales bacterium]MCB9650408.1 PhnD/SsuA/transferrin family substrate-binding protein [Deltaproteobacteria bacterium]
MSSVTRRFAFASALGTMLLLVGAGSASAAEPVLFLICQPGGPDLAQEQQEVVEKLYRYLEKKTGLADGQIHGVYTNSRPDCERELANKPTVFLPSLPVFMEYRKSLNLEAVAQLQIDGQVRDHFYIMAAKGAGLTLEKLAGKTLAGTHLDSKKFVEDIVLEGRVALKDVKLSPQRMGLRAIREVVRGKADAVLLDGTQYRALQGTRFQEQLELVHVSKDVPTPPVAIVKQRGPAGFGKKLAQALVGMGADPEGQSVLRLFSIEGFAVPKPQTWAQLEARFRSAP